MTTNTTTWQDHAHDALAIVYRTEIGAGDAFAALRDEMGAFIAEQMDGVGDPAPISERWATLGALALAVGEAMTGERLSLEHCHGVLCRKQLDYGPLNIWRFSRPGRPGGLLVRCWDKVARIENLTTRSVTPENESLLDSFLDLVNYAAIGLMVERDVFLAPLAP
jgi:hypothetical protein